MTQHAVFIHGMWGRAWQFPQVVAEFKNAGYQCHTPVLRYHSTLEAADKLAKCSVLDYVSDLEKIIAKLDSKPVIIGHSMGGLLAQMLAAKGLARQLVLVTTATPRGIFATLPSVVYAFSGITTTYRFWKKAHRMAKSKYSYSVLNNVPKTEHAAIYQKLGYESGRAIFEIGFWPFDRKKTTYVNFGAVLCPLLIVSGAEDRITPNYSHRQLVKKYPQAVLKTYQHHAHHLLAEAAGKGVGSQVIIQDILHWLNN